MSNDQPYTGSNLVIDYTLNTITVSTLAAYVEEVNIEYETYNQRLISQDIIIQVAN
jgi:hypothetical protein